MTEHSSYAEPRRGDDQPALVTQWCTDVALIGRVRGAEAARAGAFDLLVDVSVTAPHLLEYSTAALAQVCLDVDQLAMQTACCEHCAHRPMGAGHPSPCALCSPDWYQEQLDVASMDRADLIAYVEAIQCTCADQGEAFEPCTCQQR